MSAPVITKRDGRVWSRLALVAAVVGVLCGSWLLVQMLRAGEAWAPSAVLVALNVVFGVVALRQR